MIQSMTGYGKAVVTFNEKKINVEIKSLNSKQLDLNTRVAPLYREKEMEIRQMISAALLRGKVDFSLWIEKDAAVDATPINAALVENYYQQIKAISAATGIPEPTDWYYTILRLPDVTTKTDVEVLSEEEWVIVKKAIEEAIKRPLPIWYRSVSRKVPPFRRSSRRRSTISVVYWKASSHLKSHV